MCEEQDDNDEWEDYESGPFCRHWSDPEDCDAVCVTCGHGCTRHDFGVPGECFEDGCDCVKWIEL